MIKKAFIILLSFFMFSCQTDNGALDDALRNQILEYQDSFPISKKSDSIFPLYLVTFKKIKNDTLFYIGRTEVYSQKTYANFEIFEDEQLMPTALFDLDSLAKNLIEKYPKRKGELLLKGPSLKNYNPRYWYEIQQGEIYLLRKEEIKNVK